MGPNELVVLPYGLLDRPSLRYVETLIMLTRSLGKPSHPTSLHRGIHRLEAGEGYAMEAGSESPSATLDEVERATVLNRLRHFKGHRQRTAQSLGIAEHTLSDRIKDMRVCGIVDAVAKV